MKLTERSPWSTINRDGYPNVNCRQAGRQADLLLVKRRPNRICQRVRILEECPLVPKKMDLRAVTEMVGLETPLADRTPYAGHISVEACRGPANNERRSSRNRYWRWDEIEVSSEPEKSRLASVYKSFQIAVNRRIRNDKATTAYLSGGLDSRCLVTALEHSGVRLRTVNSPEPERRTTTAEISLRKESGQSTKACRRNRAITFRIIHY